MSTEPVCLHAGPVTVDLDNGDLRCIRWGDTEVIRRIYMVFQDQNWTSRPWVLGDVAISQRADNFTVTFSATGTCDAQTFTWDCCIEGSPEGSITYTVTGTAAQSFIRNRLGLCVLHPMALAGSPVEIEHASSGTEESFFPLEINPDQPFLDIRAMTHTIDEGVRARLELNGDVFECEDHRNWSDASFKTYCTPISLPFPVTVEAGWRCEQSASLSFDGTPPRQSHPTPADTINIEVFDACSPLPKIGLQATHEPITDAHLAALKVLRLDHLRIDIDAKAGIEIAERTLRDTARQAKQIGSTLHVAMFDAPESAMSELAAINRELGNPVTCWYIFRSDEKVTSRIWIDQARVILGKDAVIGGGTNLYFTELNRQPPDTSDLDVVNFSMNPQVHSFDNRTIIQNAHTAMVIAQNAPRLAGQAQISVGPITLRPRFNPNATNPASDVSNDGLPPSVDCRQPTWFAAAWAALSIGFLAGPGTIDSVTYFETVGPRGVLEARSADPYPVHSLFAALAGQTSVRMCASSHPEICDALIIEGNSDGSAGSRVIIANLSASEHEIQLHGFLNERITAAPHNLTIVDMPGGNHGSAEH